MSAAFFYLLPSGVANKTFNMAKTTACTAEMTLIARQKFLSILKPFVNKGDYKSALVITKRHMKIYPTDLTARYQHAKILGDWADELPAKRQRALKSESVKILRPLMRRLNGRPLDERFGLCLNYYYQSQNWRGMYGFGRRFSKSHKQKALYAQSLGATLLAFELHEQRGRGSEAWARRAVKTWSKYNLKSDTYYFAHYCFAKALALSGRLDDSMKSLKTAARLGKRKITDWEFADVLKLCSR